MHEPTYQELCEDLRFAEETLDECLTQYHSEVELYGDAWPGALMDVQKCRDTVTKLRREVTSHAQYNPSPTMYADIPY